MLILSTIYIFIPASGYVGRGLDQCTALPGTYNAVKMALLLSSIIFNIILNTSPFNKLVLCLELCFISNPHLNKF